MKINSEHNIYILKIYGKNNTEAYKLGYSGDIIKRLDSYKFHYPLYELVMTYKYDNSIEFERYIHSKFISIMMNEWYDKDTITELMSSIDELYEKFLYDIDSPINLITTFSGVLKELDKLRKEDDLDFYLKVLEDANTRFENIKDVIEILGWDIISDLEYHKGNIDRVLKLRREKIKFKESEAKIITILLKENKFRNGKFYSSKEIKEYFQDLYNNLDLDVKAKGTDINKYFNVKSGYNNIKGKKTRGVHILQRLVN